MKSQNILSILALTGFLFLNAGVIRKEFDPIKNTQTDSIAYKQKMEEIKDGEKGPPTPSYKFYEKADFLGKNPMQTQAEELIPAPAAAPVPAEASGMEGSESVAEPLPETPPETPGGEDWWQDDQEDKPVADGGAPKDIQAPSSSKGDPVWEEKW